MLISIIHNQTILYYLTGGKKWQEKVYLFGDGRMEDGKQE